MGNEAVGLASLFGLDLWVPLGVPRSTIATKSNFQTVVNLASGRCAAGPSAVNLMALIPHGTRNTFEIEPRSQRGFKFEWQDVNGVQWHVHGHEPDAGAQLGHVGAGGWIVRINYRPANRAFWLLSRPLISNFPASHPNYAPPANWSNSNSQVVMANSHIPLDL